MNMAPPSDVELIDLNVHRIKHMTVLGTKVVVYN